jgi:hypothetical protein
MIVAIEGPSTAGKTFGVHTRAPRYVKEAPSNLDAPDLFADPIEFFFFLVEGRRCGQKLLIERRAEAQRLHNGWRFTIRRLNFGWT